jgi:glycosyltransferase involved in cell wall biosynthesis
MNLRSLFLILVCFLPINFLAAKPRKTPVEIVVLMPSYNNEQWYEKNLDSIICQTYPHFTIYYINDCSTDRTNELVQAYFRSHGLQDKVTYVNNTARIGALANIYNAVHNIRAGKVVVICDGDDWLAHPRVLETVADVYNSNKDIWLTYGTLKTVPHDIIDCCEELPYDIIKNRKFRSYKWVTSHLRTFYAKLFQQIKKEDLQLQGEFFRMTYDQAIMFPMLEMASEGHFKFIPEVLYRYNMLTPLNDNKVNAQLQKLLELYIRAMPPYKPLKNLIGS